MSSLTLPALLNDLLPWIIGCVPFLAFLYYAESIRKWLFRALFESLLTFGVVLAIIKGLSYSFKRWITADFIHVLGSCRNQLSEIHLPEFYFYLAGACIVLPLLIRWYNGKIMVSKPGSARYESSTTFMDSQVSLLNYLPSLLKAIQSVLKDTSTNTNSNQGKTSVIEEKNGATGAKDSQTFPAKLQLIELEVLSEKMDELYAEMAQIKTAINTLTDHRNMSNQIEGNLGYVDYCAYTSEEEDEEEFPQVASLSTPKRKKLSLHDSEATGASTRQILPAPANVVSQEQISTATNTPMDFSSYAGMSEDEVRKILVKRNREFQAAKKLPEFLTDEEKMVARRDVAELNRSWKKKNPNYTVRDYDLFDIGCMTEAEANLPRRDVRRIISNRIHSAILLKAKEEGKEIEKCGSCGYLFVKERQHRCMFASWGQEKARRGVPYRKDMCVALEGAGTIKINRKNRVDEDKVLKQFNNLLQHQVVVSDSKVQERALLGETQAIVPVSSSNLESQAVALSPVVEIDPQSPRQQTMTDHEDVQLVNLNVDPSLVGQLVTELLQKLKETPFRQSSGSFSAG